MDPVDEFARLKNEIRTLEERANLLRAGFLAPGARLRSNQHEVVVRSQKRRVFQKDRLPPAILNDPRYWDETQAEVVTVRSLSSAPLRAAHRDDFDVIERF